MARWHPRVTAMLPAYNSAAFIQRTLDCLAAQTWDNLEILIADDCSTDETPRLLAAFAAAHPNVRLLRRERNMGWLENSNALMAEASGELLFFAFHDDVVDRRYVALLVDALRKRPDAIMAYADFKLHYPDGRRKIGRLKALAEQRSTFGRGRVMIARPPFWGAPMRGLFRRSAFERIGGLQPNAAGDFSADWPWLVHMSLLGNFVRVPKLLVWKHYQPTSKTMLWTRSAANQRAMRRSAYREVWRSGVPLRDRIALIAYGALGLEALRPHLPRGLKRTLARALRS
jgi:glycosyltransferase involved in cell wall biosynthesis